MQIPQITTQESPRKVISALFKSLDTELPISGGWGYSKQDAVVIDKNDPVVPKDQHFDGLGIERIFVEKRIYTELIISRPPNLQYAGIEWKLIKQALRSDNDRKFDFMTYNVTAFARPDWEELKKEWEGILENAESSEDLKSKFEEHSKKRESKMQSYTAEYWFDITSFFGCY